MINRIKNFLRSFLAFCLLYKGGFRISHSVMEKNNKSNFDIYRFYWNDHVIRDMPDIDNVNNHWNTIRNGHVERLGNVSAYRIRKDVDRVK